MSLRMTLPLAALLLAGCASTGTRDAKETPNPAADLPPPERSHTESVDDHLPTLTPQSDETGADTSIEDHVHDSVYERMLHSFALPDCASHQISRNWAQWFADRPEYMERVLRRAEPWIYFIVDEIERRGLPGELALLPIVESAYDPFAYSSGRALGTWQFISSTGRQYGLDQNWWYDGRRDVYASTHAALDYLTYLQNYFDGDWLLALAGYNAGHGRVGRSMRRNLRAGKPGDFWSLKLPRETRAYVPKLLGLTCLFLNADKYGFTPLQTPNEPVITTVDFGTQTDLVLVSQKAELPIDQLFALNPGYNRWATPPEGPYRIVLPLDAADRLGQNDMEVGAQDLMRWDQVTVQRGDTLSGLAARHDVPLSVLRTANSIEGDLIQPGQKLRLPRDQQMMVDPLYAAAATELARLQSGLFAADRKTHRVRSGESLSVIAKRYRVSVRELQRWNNISDPRQLRAGQQLTVFMAPGASSSSKKGTNYTVRRGDSLWSIAQKHNVEMSDLMRWNGLNQNSVLRPGQSLKVSL